MMKFLRTQMKWIMAIIVVAFLLSTFLMYEGRGTRRTPGRNPDGSMTDYEVAQINGRSLMRSELEQRLRNYLSQYSTRSMASIDMPAIYRSVLDQAILESQLAKEVEEKGIRVSDAEADMAMKSYADTYFPTREAFYQVLANSGIKVDDYKKSIARQMASDRLIREAIGEVTVSEDKVAEFYDTMKAILYSQPEGFKIHMADFSTSSDAEYFRSEIASGASWDVLASGDSLASKDVINITKSPVRLPASTFRTGILSVLASLDVGKVSPVFAVSSNDFGVAMKVEHVDAGTIPYSEVSGDIRTLLTQQEERMRLTAYEESLRKKANVVINDTELFASPATSGDVSQSGDILPIMNLEETSGDEPEETPVTVSEEKPVETPATVTEEKPVETPEPVSDEKPVETPAPVTEEKPAETPAPVTEEKPEETPAPVTEEKPEETPAPVTEEKPVETPAVVSEEKPVETPATVTDEKPAETPEPVTEEKPEETPAVMEDVPEEAPIPVTASEDKPAVTETEPEVSQDISADKK
ncbi:MAG: SurA N-terminal domain-containing protein [Synergistaceae bacterium]|nr:SurA N-terminal domain-containing protein [Synergistaceae bacterium]